MKVPLSWLREFLPGAPAAEETAELLTGIGLPVEEVHDYPGAPAGVLAVRLDNLGPVPGSDHLLQADAWDGERHWRVLTGAPNAAEGMLTAFAPPGTQLPAVGAEIGTRVMAGLKSEGMLCSARELGIYDHAAGLLELPDEVEPGARLSELWPGDSVLELEITPNRADALSILGVARDLGAKLGLEARLPFSTSQVPEQEGEAAGVRVDVQDAEACPLFTLRRVDGLQVGASPIWLQRRLAMMDLRPRNNVIDITNYVNFELGQPSHAYDLRALIHGTIGVRRARHAEEFETLQEEKLELHADDLVITTGGRAIGLAGVIGGMHDSVKPDTTSVALEVAHFNPPVVRAGAKRHAQHTDAHYRFERGVDPNLPFLASARISGLLEELAGGKPADSVAVSGQRVTRPQVAFRPVRVEFLTSVDVDVEVQARYLEALGCQLDRSDPARWLVRPPSWRFDLAIEEDMIEEVIRLHGYDHIGASTPHMQFTPPLTDPTHRRLSAWLAASGFQELISYSFTSDTELQRARAPEAKVRLRDPQGQESSVLRTALYPSLLAAAVRNRQQPSLALFEIGKVFRDEETERLALLLSGSWQEAGWQKRPVRADAFLLKGQLERLAASKGARLQLSNRQFAPLHPGVSAEVTWNGKQVGFLGQLHPAIAAELELRDVFLCELELPLEGNRLDFSEPGRQEKVERDLALITPDTVNYAELRELLAPVAGPQLESLVPFDVFKGERIGEGRQSVALRFTFRHAERTLTDAEVTAHMSNVMRVAKDAGYDVRDG